MADKEVGSREVEGSKEEEDTVGGIYLTYISLEDTVVGMAVDTGAGRVAGILADRVEGKAAGTEVGILADTEAGSKVVSEVDSRVEEGSKAGEVVGSTVEAVGNMVSKRNSLLYS